MLLLLYNAFSLSGELICVSDIWLSHSDRQRIRFQLCGTGAESNCRAPESLEVQSILPPQQDDQRSPIRHPPQDSRRLPLNEYRTPSKWAVG